MAVTANQLNQLYLAYFGRPVDFGGYTFFTTDANSTVGSVATSFANSDESKALYGTDPTVMVNAIYNNLFNRDADLAGLQYWVGLIQTGKISAPMAALSILQGAQGSDSTCITNKLGVSQTFFNHIDTGAEAAGYAGSTAASIARTFLHTVDSTAASVTTATGNVDGTLSQIVASASTTPSYWITQSAGSVAEGGFETFTINTANVAAGTTLGYTITGTGDAASLTGSGSATIDSSGKAAITIQVPSNTVVGDSGTLQLSLLNGQANSASVSVTDASPVPTYTVIASSASVAEGSSETFTVATTNLAAGTAIGYTITGTGNAAGQSSTGTLTVDATGHASVTVNVPTNSVVGDSGTLKFALNNAQSTSTTVNVTDATVVAPTYSIATSGTSVAEGATETFTINASNVADGTVIGYTITGTGSATGASATGSATVTGGKATVAVTAPTNNVVGDSGSLQLVLSNGQASSTVVQVTDATAPAYTLNSSAATVAEGQTVTFSLQTNLASGTFVGYTVAGTNDAAGLTGSGSFTVDASGKASVTFTVPANMNVNDAGTLTLTLLTDTTKTTSVNVTDATPTTFTVDATTIVTANASGSPVVVTLPNGMTAAQSATVTIQSTDAILDAKGIVIQGNGNATVNMGTVSALNAGTETVYVGGTGNTTVNMGTSADSLALGSGNDTVVVSGFTLQAGEKINTGTGTDTLDVTGVTDLTAGTLTGIENMTIHTGTAKVTAAEAAAFTSIAGAAGATAKLAIVAAGATDLSGKLSGLNTIALTGAGSITLTAADLSGVTTVTTAAGTSITTTVAGALELLAVNAAVNYSISDTAANLASAPASVFQGANLSTVSQAGATALTVAQAVAVWTNNHNATFTVSDTAANLYNAVVYDGNADVLKLATAPNATVQVTGTATAQQAGVLKGLAHATFAVSDSIAHLNTAGLTAQLGAFTTVVTALTLSGKATAVQANAIAAYAGTHVAGLVVADTAANVAGLGATAIADATSISVTDVVNVATISGLSAAISAKLASGYALSDTAAHLISGSLVSNAAGNITATDASIGVAVAAQLETLSNSGTKAFVLQDTATNLAGASAAVLHDATAITVQGNVTVAQANAISGYAVPSYHLVDTAANVIGASAAVIAKGLAGGGSIAISDASVSYATAAQVYNVSNTIAFNISDSASTIAALTSAVGYAGSTSKTVLDHATAVTLTGTATVAQADSIYAANIGGAHHGSSTAAISDSVANVVAAAADVAVTGSASIHATGTATVANVVTLLGLVKFDGQYAISDTATNVATAINAATLTNAQLNASTAPVVLTGTVDVVHAGYLHNDAAFTNWNGQYNMVDTVANLQAAFGATPALLTSAASVKVLDTVGNVNGNYPWITTHTNGYMLNDTAGNLLGNAIVVGSALQATVNSGAVTAATAKALNAENSGKVVYDVADTAANLSGANLTTNLTGVANAKTVTVTDVGGTTVAVVAAIKAANATAGLTYSLADTAANLIANAALTTGATAVTVNDASVSAAVAAQVLAIRAAAFTAISDTAANIAAAAAATIDAAGTVKVTDHDRVTLNATEIAHFTEAGGLVNGFTSTAGGLGNAAPMYNLADTAANLVALFGVTPASLTDAGKVTFVAGGAAQTAGAIQAIITAVTAAKVSGSYALSDTVANLIAGGNNAAVKGAASVTATGAAANVGDATTLYNLNNAASYTVSDTAANVAAGGAGVAHATTITMTTDATVAQLAATHAANAGATLNYALADTAANLAAATAGQLTGAVMLTVNTAATVAQMDAIDAKWGHNQAMNVTDTAANLSAASSSELAVATGVVATGTATAAQGVLLAGKTFVGGTHVTYTVTDTATNLAANTGAVTVNATAVTVTTAATIAEAAKLSVPTFFAGAHLAYGIADTAANLLSIDTQGLWNANGNVTVTDNVDVATAERIYAINAASKFNVVDTEANVAAALNQTSAGGAAGIDLNDMLGHAQSVTVSGVGAIKLVSIGGDYVVTGSVATLQALPADLKAHGYAVSDTVANIVANFGFVAAGTSGKYGITDTGANIAAAATTLVSGAAQVKVTGATDAATATTIYTANNAASYSVSDTAANLAAAGNATGVQHATAVTATTAATVAQAATIFGVNAAASFAVSDTLANVIAGGNVHATAITMTGNAAVAQLAAVQGANGATPLTYSLSDSAANLAAATAAQLSGATAVAATTAATGAQAATIYASAPVATYSINDTVVANLFTGDTLKASTTHATTIAGAVANADVAQATALNGLGAQFTGSYTITDAALLVSGATQAVLDKATAVTLTGTVDAAHATLVAGETFSGAHTALTGVNGAAEKDVSASILAAANAAGLAGANSVEATDTISVATATSINNGATYAKTVGGHVVFDQLSDTSTNLQLGAAAVVNDATHINVTNSVNMGLAQFVENNVGTAGAANYTFAQISDTAANVLSDTATAGRASTITLTGTADVSHAEQLITSSIFGKVSGGYNVADNAGNILTAYWDQDHAAAVTGAAHLTVTGTANVSQATVLENLANVATDTVAIQDTLAAVNAAAAGIKNLAASLTVTVNDAGAGVYSDTGLTPQSHLVYSHTGAFDADPTTAVVVLNGGPANQWTSANFDVLTLKTADTIDLSAYTVTQQAAALTVADNTYELVRGDVSNGGQTFTADAAGNSLMLLWDADATAAVHETGVILVGATGFTSTDVTAGATHPVFHV